MVKLFYQIPGGAVLLFALQIRMGQSLAISPVYQRNGYGEILIKFAVNKILDAGYANVSLDIMEGNIAAENLYIKLGFRKK